MSVFSSDKIRNICLLGHGGDGKTSLAESMLFLTKGTDRLGRVADGNTVLDFDAEETKRKISIQTSLAFVEYGGCKINIIDTPGYFDFAGEVMQGLRVADLGLIICTAKSGIGVGTEKSWKYLNDRKKAKMIYVGKLDEENTNFYNVLDSLRQSFGVSVCPLIIPAMEGDKPVGIIDLVNDKAYKIDGGKSVEMPIPDSMKDRVEECKSVLSESVAETSEELMEKFFGGEAFTKEEFIAGIKAGIAGLSLVPVVCGSGYTGLGTEQLMDAIAQYAPSPLESAPEIGKDASDTEVKVEYSPTGATCAIVFKTISDQYGKFSFFKVISGSVKADMTLVNSRTSGNEKIGHIYVVKGKKNTEVSEVVCGDIGAIAKLVDTKTGDTLAAGKAIALDKVAFAVPGYTLAVKPKVKGGEEKIASGLSKLREEDPSFKTQNNAETRQYLVSGAGDIQIDVLCSKLKNKFGVEVELEEPRVPYREKVRKKVKIQGRHKKQSGGHGQFGDVWIEFEPNMENDDFIFDEKIFGGSVPKNFHPAVEKGLRDCMVKGVLAGYPVVALKATLVDGSYHDVDSSEMAFKVAAGLAFKAGLPQANPVILEPIGALKVYVPDHYMGDIIGDLNKRRGRVMGMNPTDDGLQIVEAEVPMAEMHSYTIDLRSMTQGRGYFTFDFERYEETPMNIQQKVIEDAKVFMEEAE